MSSPPYPTVGYAFIPPSRTVAHLCQGSPDALRSLLRYNAHQAFLYAISVFQEAESARLKAAFARALRALAVAVADAVGPSQWGIRNDAPTDVRNEAKMALDYLFQVSTAPSWSGPGTA